MSIHIDLRGDESTEHVTAVVRALSAYAGLDTLSVVSDAPKSAAADAAKATSTTDAPVTETAAAKKKREAAEAAAAKKAADEAAAAAKAAEAPPADDGPDRTVDEIRGLAGQFSTAETRPHAISILRDAGVKSVSEFEGKTAAERVKAYDALQAKLDEIALG